MRRFTTFGPSRGSNAILIRAGRCLAKATIAPGKDVRQSCDIIARRRLRLAHLHTPLG